MSAALWLLAAAACTTEPADSAPDSECGATGDDEVDLDVELSAEAGRISARVVAPTSGDPGTAPVVLQLIGRWYTSAHPDDGSIPVPGTVVLRVDLTGDDWGDGTDDVRGPNARAAVAAALRYAHGNAEDGGGCRLNERFLVANPERVVLLGQSNGGNLALATLADASLDIPAPTGVVLWETPAGAQFANMDFGSIDGVYVPGRCSFAGADGVTCAYAAGVPLVTRGDDVCFDLDLDGACGAADANPHPPTDPMTGRKAASPALADALVAAGLDNPWDSAAEARVFWAERDAARLAPAAVARFPQLPFLLLASEEDHALPNLPDHPHVYGLGEALQAAGATWVRLNPGMEYTGLSSENPANETLNLDHPDAWLFSEADENPLSEVYVEAVEELRTRADAGEWD